MNKTEITQKINALVLYYNPWENDGGGTRDEYLSRILDEYTQRVSKEILNKFQNQKFFHALPPTAKDEFYKWINQQEEQ